MSHYLSLPIYLYTNPECIIISIEAWFCSKKKKLDLLEMWYVCGFVLYIHDHIFIYTNIYTILQNMYVYALCW